MPPDDSKRVEVRYHYQQAFVESRLTGGSHHVSGNGRVNLESPREKKSHGEEERSDRPSLEENPQIQAERAT